MKSLILACGLSVLAFGAFAQKTDKSTKAKFEFKSDTHDFGNVKEGPAAEYAFEFKNVGKEPLVIQNAQASCGCTTPEWPKEPILPGKKGKIVVRYNTQGRPGPIDKTVWISSNAETEKERYELHIKGNVVPSATDVPGAKEDHSGHGH